MKAGWRLRSLLRFYLGETKENMVTSVFMGVVAVDIIKYDE